MATATDKTKTKKPTAPGRGTKVEQSGKVGESAPAGTPTLRQRYQDEVIKALMAEFSYTNVNQVPRLDKITINFGLGEAVANPNVIKTSLDELTQMAGQKPVTTRAKKAIANFKLRAGLPIGCMVTLRRERMWEFLHRLISVAMPRIRDFKGISGKAFASRPFFPKSTTTRSIRCGDTTFLSSPRPTTMPRAEAC